MLLQPLGLLNLMLNLFCRVKTQRRELSISILSFFVLFVYSYEHHMYLCYELCLAVRPYILRGKNFNVRHYTQAVLPNIAILKGTIDIYHFVPLSLNLTLPGSHKVTARKTYWLHFLTFHLLRITFNEVMKQFKLNIMDLLLSKTD